MKKSILLIFMTFIAVSLYAMYKSCSNNTIILPSPTGAYNVGTTFLSLKDKDRLEQHNIPTHRELAVQIWYPTEMNSHYDAYAKHSVEYIKKAVAEMKNLEVNALDYVNDISTHAISNAPIAHIENHYPVVIFSPGFGAPQEIYTMLLEELASHGYIVFGINHPYASNPSVFADGRVILPDPAFKKLDTPESRKLADAELSVWIQDINFLVNQLSTINETNSILKNKLNLEQIAVFGHSFGGRAAIEVSRTNQKIKAGADLDGKLTTDISTEGFDTPFLFIFAERENTKEIERIQELRNNMTNDTNLITIKGADHNTFSDLSYIFKTWFHKSKLDPIKGIEIIRTFLVTFFDKYLKNNQLSLIEIGKSYPEVLISKCT